VATEEEKARTIEIARAITVVATQGAEVWSEGVAALVYALVGRLRVCMRGGTKEAKEKVYDAIVTTIRSAMFGEEQND
jgi:hypothetical protein